MNEKILTEMLQEAYDAGWYGSRELRDETVEAIRKKYADKITTDAGFVPGSERYITTDVTGTTSSPVYVISTSFTYT
jgi:hypothetical protein